MIIDSHGHVTAPDSLYVYKAQILAHRGAHGRGGNLANDDDVKKALNAPVFGGSSHLAQLQEVGTDLQLISPRPYQMMTNEHPRLVQWFVEETNNIIAKQVQLYPDTFRGVCGLPVALRRVYGWWSGTLRLPYTPVGSLRMWCMGSPIVLVRTLVLGSAGWHRDILLLPSRCRSLSGSPFWTGTKRWQAMWPGRGARMPMS